VLVGDVPPGTHDLVLFDGVQEVARRPGSVTIDATAAPQMLAIGTLTRMDEPTANSWTAAPSPSSGSVRRLGPPRQRPDGWQRAAAIQVSCDADATAAGCAVGGVPLSTRPPATLRLAAPSGTTVAFVVGDVVPAAPPSTRRIVVRFASAPEVVGQMRPGDRDDLLDDRAATVGAVSARRAGSALAEVDATLTLGLDGSAEAWSYRGRALKQGAPFTLTTERYVMDGVVLRLGETAGHEQLGLSNTQTRRTPLRSTRLR